MCPTRAFLAMPSLTRPPSPCNTGWPHQGARMRRQHTEPAGTGAGTVAAAGPERPVTGGVRSLEVRWIFPGPLQAAVVGWFARFPGWTESREDTYLLDPHLPGLSVKVRGAGALEVKVYRGNPGLLQVAGRARGRLESWHKWSFPADRPSQVGELAGWRTVRKRRRMSRFSLAGGQSRTRAPGPADEPGCEVELTEIRTRDQTWWTLGFEATGPARLQRGELEATAALVFALALPAGIELGIDDSRSYAEWLRRPAEGS